MRRGAGDRTRTGDINLGKVALYQLSYARSGFYRVSYSLVSHDVTLAGTWSLLSDLN